MTGAPGAVERAVRTYLDHLVVERGVAANTLSSYRRDLRRYRAYLAERGITDLTQVGEGVVADFLVRLREGDAEHQALSSTSAARTLVAVRGFHRFAVADGLVEHDPAAGVRPPQPAKRLPKALPLSDVEAILDAAERLVLADGVEALTTRAIATEAAVPVASLYQYFGDKEAVLLALAGRDMEEMDAQVAEDLAALEVLSVGSVVRVAMQAFVTVYRRRPAFVEIYLRGRTNVAVARFGRAHNVRVADALRSFALERGLCREDLTLDAATLAVEVGDRVFQLAYENTPDGDAALVEEGITMMTAYLERYATDAGLAGVPA